MHLLSRLFDHSLGHIQSEGKAVELCHFMFIPGNILLNFSSGPEVGQSSPYLPTQFSHVLLGIPELLSDGLLLILQLLEVLVGGKALECGKGGQSRNDFLVNHLSEISQCSLCSVTEKRRSLGL